MQYHSCRYFFAERRMEIAKSDGGRDSRMPQQNLVHFMWRDVFASANNNVLHSSGQMQVAILVKHSFVAGSKPTVHKRASVRFRIIFISAKHVCSLNGHFAPLIRSEM